MAWYDMTDKVKKIADMEQIEERAIVAEADLTKTDDVIWATNRMQEVSINSRLRRLEEEKAAKEFHEKRKEGFHWVKDEEGWAIAGSFTSEHKEGSMITVTKANGKKSLEKIARFSCSGNAYVE